jgi:hypothetical protein
MMQWMPRIRAAAIHLALSASVAALAAVVVFAFWYPYPYRVISGGRELFLLLTGVDVVIGPLITLAVFNLAKPRAELRRDLAIVGVLQVAALAYGLWTVAEARPVHLVFEIDRFRVVHRVEIADELLPQTPAGIDAYPWRGPTLLSLRPFRDERERMEDTLAALQGVPLGSRPDLWQTYDAGRKQVIAASRPLAQLQARAPAQSQQVAQAVRDLGLDPTQIGYLPLASRRAFWTVLIDRRNGDPVGFLPIDSF